MLFCLFALSVSTLHHANGNIVYRKITFTTIAGMMPMEIRTLRYFLAVAQEENMTRAAARLHLTQPTLSKALKSLEAELDTRLFVRHS